MVAQHQKESQMINKTIKQVENDPLKAYEARQAEIRKLLKQIEDGLEKHDRRASSFGPHHWGHVGDLISIAHTLQEVSDQLHLTGEYAKTW
jgi:hypothetical protein